MMSSKEIDAFDIRNAAVHECAHVLVAEHYGTTAYPVIWKNSTLNHDFEKKWIGQTYFSGKRPTKINFRRISIAGYLAERMDKYDSPTDIHIFEIEDLFECSFGETFEESDGWSQSDWDLAHGYTLKDIHATHAILSNNWEKLIKNVNLLIIDTRKREYVATKEKKFIMIKRLKIMPRSNRTQIKTFN